MWSSFCELPPLATQAEAGPEEEGAKEEGGDTVPAVPMVSCAPGTGGNMLQVLSSIHGSGSSGSSKRRATVTADVAAAPRSCNWSQVITCAMFCSSQFNQLLGRR